MAIKKAFFIRSLQSIIVFLVILTSAVYLSDHSSAFVAEFARYTDLPAESINSHLVGFGQIYTQLNAIRYSPDASTLTTDELIRLVTAKIRREYAALDLARDLNALPTKKEMQTLVDSYIADQLGSSEAVRPFLRPLSLSEFKRFMIEPLIVEQSIAKKIILDEENDAYARIQNISAQVNSQPELFDTFAAQYIQEQHLTATTTEQVLSAEDLSQEDIALLRSVAEGHTTPVIASYDGYRLYKIVQHFTEPQEAWLVRELFMPVSIDDRIQEYLDDQYIIQFAQSALKQSL